MSYSRQDIQEIIARNKKRKASKSPSPPMSQKSIQFNRSISPKDMALRYQEICSKYRSLLEQVKDKNHKFQMQQTQLQRLRSEKERDQKQLFRLRSMIGFIKKEDKGFQTNMDMQSGGSWGTKIEKSTTIQSPHQFEFITPVKSNELGKLSNKLSPNHKQLNKTANNKNGFKATQQSQIQNDFYRMKAQSIYSPKAPDKQINSFFKVKQNKEYESKLNKLSNSPYSKLRFSRKIQP